jgi:hypothetical protein
VTRRSSNTKYGHWLMFKATYTRHSKGVPRVGFWVPVFVVFDGDFDDIDDDFDCDFVFCNDFDDFDFDHHGRDHHDRCEGPVCLID